jgi:hypothetical protein
MATERPNPFSHLLGFKSRSTVEPKSPAEIAETTAAEMARKIVAAAARARGETTPGVAGNPPLTGMAAQIIRAGKKRRNEKED